MFGFVKSIFSSEKSSRGYTTVKEDIQVLLMEEAVSRAEDKLHALEEQIDTTFDEDAIIISEVDESPIDQEDETPEENKAPETDTNNESVNETPISCEEMASALQNTEDKQETPSTNDDTEKELDTVSDLFSDGKGWTLDDWRRADNEARKSRFRPIGYNGHNEGFLQKCRPGEEARTPEELRRNRIRRKYSDKELRELEMDYRGEVKDQKKMVSDLIGFYPHNFKARLDEVLADVVCRYSMRIVDEGKLPENVYSTPIIDPHFKVVSVDYGAAFERQFKGWRLSKRATEVKARLYHELLKLIFAYARIQEIRILRGKKPLSASGKHAINALHC